MKAGRMTIRITLPRAERTRRAILDGSYRLIIRQGFAATSMREIAALSHVALGGIYNHFDSKEAIFRAIVEERHPVMQMLPVLYSVEGETLEAFVRNAARTLVEQLRKHPDFLNLMLIEIVEFKARHVPALFANFLPLAQPLAHRLAPLGTGLRDIPPLVLARAFLGMFFSYYITEMLIGRVMPPGMSADAMDHFVEIFLHGILEERTA
jgi:AcrR family transcriptional regulator